MNITGPGFASPPSPPPVLEKASQEALKTKNADAAKKAYETQDAAKVSISNRANAQNAAAVQGTNKPEVAEATSEASAGAEKAGSANTAQAESKPADQSSAKVGEGGVGQAPPAAANAAASRQNGQAALKELVG